MAARHTRHHQFAGFPTESFRRGAFKAADADQCRGALKQDHLAEWFESSTSVELPFDLLDAVHGPFGAVGTPVQGESGGYGVEVPKRMEGEASLTEPVERSDTG
ncbi:hypothetical protein ACWGQ5_34970 [Streptomyces sp. NPDC055722]